MGGGGNSIHRGQRRSGRTVRKEKGVGWGGGWVGGVEGNKIVHTGDANQT